MRNVNTIVHINKERTKKYQNYKKQYNNKEKGGEKDDLSDRRLPWEF